MATTRRTATDMLMSVIRRNADIRLRIDQADIEQPHRATPQEPSFYDHVKTNMFQNNEDFMFETLSINKAMFEASLNLVSDIPLPSRGRRSFVCTHRDKMFFLVIFLTHGVKALKMACLPKIKTVTHVLSILNDTVTLYKERIVSNTVTKRNEFCDVLPLCSAVIDCTVVEMIGPALPFKERRVFFSGKHKKYCLKRR